MALNASQISKVGKHSNITWLTDRVGRKELIHQDTIKSKIGEAIKSILGEGRDTDDNIKSVANAIGVEYGQVYVPVEVSFGDAVSEAVKEIEGDDKMMAQTIRMIFNKTAFGRTAPGTTGINHIHVGGMGSRNVLFDATTYVVLGVVDGHMDKQMSPSVSNQADRVNSRKGGGTQHMKVQGISVSKA